MKGRTGRQLGRAARCLGDTVQSKAVTLCFLGMGGLLFGMILAIAEAGRDLIAILEISYLLLVFSWLLAEGLTERKRIEQLEKLMEGLPERHLLAEVLPRPVNSMEKRYFRIMKEVSRCAVGIAEQACREKEEYCDYVEGWIHEMKTPLTACSLILANGGDAYRLRRELKRADNLTESILYYARLRTMEKDVKIGEFSAASVIEEAVKSQMELLTGAGISVEAEGDFTVRSDRGSVCFILKQLLINCSKYCRGCQVRIHARAGAISVRDNGPGIPAHELPRVTERGFTGSRRREDIRNSRGPGRAEGEEEGRAEDRAEGGAGAEPDTALMPASTGMGLYIVKEMCRRLGISLKVESREGEFTCVQLSFGGQPE